MQINYLSQKLKGTSVVRCKRQFAFPGPWQYGAFLVVEPATADSRLQLQKSRGCAIPVDANVSLRSSVPVKECMIPSFERPPQTDPALTGTS
jgi:hypothetical protein